MTTRQILGLSFLLACGFPLLVFWSWPHSRALEAELDRASEQHLVLAQAAAETLTVYQENVQATFEAIVSGVREGTDLSFARGLLEAQAFTHFCVVDAETGRILDSYSVSGRPLPSKLPGDLHEELVRRVETKSPQLDQIWIGKYGGPQFLLVESLGDRFVFASVSGDFLKRVADKVTFGQGGHMAIIDASGRILAHPDPAWVYAAKDLSVLEEIARALEQKDPEILLFFSPALSEEVVAGVSRVHGTGWRVLVPQPISEMRSTVIAGRISASLVFLSGLALSALVAMAAASVIVRPVKQVADAADQMARGRESAIVGPLTRFAPRELRTLGTSFDKMARRIETTVARITLLAQQDPATGLLNKRAFYESAYAKLEHANRYRNFSLLHVDLNNLKRINDIYGHATGDEAIAAIARCLRAIFPTNSLVGRVGGDEFMVLIECEEDVDLKSRLAPIIDGQSVEIGNGHSGCTTVDCSVGVACTCPGTIDFDLLVNQADEAMYYAKKRSIGLQKYDQEMQARTHRRIELSSQLRRDVAFERIGIAFQPIFSVATGEIIAFEALARWQTARLGAIAPKEFLTVAQDAGIMSDLDRCVRRKAFALVRELRDCGSHVPVSVNVTAPDLACTNYVEKFKADLFEAGLQGADINLEVTELIFHDRFGLAIQTLTELADIGVSIHLDDFGKGFSSHGLLALYNFKSVKVDMHFAGDPVRAPKSAAIVASLIHLGKQLGLTVIVEGIETPAELEFAQSQEIDCFQGFLLGRPVDQTGAINMVDPPRLLSVAD